jgi:RecA/RadA recombinase
VGTEIVARISVKLKLIINSLLPILFSIAGMVRTEYDSSSSADMALRTALLFRVAKELKWISDIFKVCIVVINQVCKLRVTGALETEHRVQCY